MTDFCNNSVYFGVAVSLVGYVIGVQLKKKFKLAVLNPLMISIIFVVGVVLLFKLDYPSYKKQAEILNYLLTPATIALAIPLYQQLSLLRKNLLAVICGIISGVFASMSSVLAMSVLFSLSHEDFVTLLPKSITTAIGMGVSEELGGIQTITVAVIIVTGVLGNVIGEGVCKLFRITEPISRGLALGTAAHAIGTAKALEMGEIEGAMSSLSIAVSGLLTVVFASFYAMVY
ncbi:MAG: LrgB family protein [Eubacterium sp.]|jgi:predicted murein hydrolase (TIGR00659 family)|nr:LrgB family protein [Eubacterium sp.]